MIDQCVIEFKDLHIVGISHEEIHIVRASLKAHFNASKLFQVLGKAIISFFKPSKSYCVS